MGFYGFGWAWYGFVIVIFAIFPINYRFAKEADEQISLEGPSVRPYKKLSKQRSKQRAYMYLPVFLTLILIRIYIYICVIYVLSKRLELRQVTPLVMMRCDLAA